MSQSLPQNRDLGGGGLDLGSFAGQQLLARSTDHRSSHPGILGDLRSSRHLGDMGLKHLHCSSHCVKLVSRGEQLVV